MYVPDAQPGTGLSLALVVSCSDITDNSYPSLSAQPGIKFHDKSTETNMSI